MKIKLETLLKNLKFYAKGLQNATKRERWVVLVLIFDFCNPIDNTSTTRNANTDWNRPICPKTNAPEADLLFDAD